MRSKASKDSSRGFHVSSEISFLISVRKTLLTFDQSVDVTLKKNLVWELNSPGAAAVIPSGYPSSNIFLSLAGSWDWSRTPVSVLILPNLHHLLCVPYGVARFCGKKLKLAEARSLIWVGRASHSARNLIWAAACPSSVVGADFGGWLLARILALGFQFGRPRS